MTMAELKERFSMADEIGTVDLWTEARRRAASPEARPVPDARWSPGWRRVGTGVVAFAVFAAAAMFAWDLSRPVRESPPTPAVDLAAELPEGWSELPPPPANRSGAATAWTGSQLLVWGGHEYSGSNEDPGADGFAFDAATRRWEPLPPSPLEGRSDAAFAWTGRELLIWGGWDGGFRDPPYFGDGAAFDPVAGTWRTLAPAPIEARTAFSVWTGEEMIVWGSRERAERRRDGAAYDPSTNTWRTIADGPLDITDGSAVWTGEEMIVFGAALDGNNHADTPTAIAAAYDPQADSWRELPPSELSPQAMTAEWLNGELIAWDYDHASAAYDPVADAWQPLPDVPLAFSECYPASVATARIMFGEFCGKTVVFAPEERAWHRVPMEAPAPDTSDGCCPVFEPMAAGDVVLVATHWYGAALEAMDRRMFAYNPPVVVRTDPTGQVVEPEPLIPTGAERDGDRIRLPVVFPDGSRATLVYPIPLDLATRGVQPDVAYIFDGRYQGRIVFLHDPEASISRYVEGNEPATTVPSPAGEVEVWRAREVPDHDAEGWLRYRLSSWTVLVPLEEQSLAERVTTSLHVLETAEGFPVIDTSGEADLAEGFGEAGGPELTFGDESPDPFMISQLDALLILSPEGCDPATAEPYSGGYGSICLGDGAVFGSIYGHREFGMGVTEGLLVEDFRPA
jgi:hypothetical protein